MYKNEQGIWLPDKNITTFVKPTEQTISQRRLEGMKKLSEIKQWGLRNPTKFMNLMFGVDLLDAQTYAVAGSWNKMYALWLMSRNAGKALALILQFPLLMDIKKWEIFELVITYLMNVCPRLK